MAVVHLTRKKSKLVVDFKVLKKYVVCYTGNDITDMCNKTMKSWQQMTGASYDHEPKYDISADMVCKNILEVPISEL